MSGKSPGLAAFLSFLLPGLGQFYAGDSGKGIMFIIFDVVLGSLAASVVGLVFAIPGWIIIAIWSMSAAYNACKRPAPAPQVIVVQQQMPAMPAPPAAIPPPPADALPPPADAPPPPAATPPPPPVARIG